MVNGSTRMTIGWFSIVIGIFAFLTAMFSQDEVSFTMGCCCVFVGATICQGGYKARKLSLRKVLYVQPQVQQVPIIVQTQAPVVPVQPPAQVKPTPPTKTQGDWLSTARNLETARDWEGAAEAYQQAGLFGEAGRIRQEHLEKDDDKVVLNIDKIGDTVLHDSVLMSDSSSIETDGTDL